MSTRNYYCIECGFEWVTHNSNCIECPDCGYAAPESKSHAEIAAGVVQPSELARLKEENEAMRVALERYDQITRHTCNIEYGNNTGVENCVKCAGIILIAKFPRRK